MKTVKLGKSGLLVPAIAVGCMRFNNMTNDELNTMLHTAIQNGANFFDHADIYAGGVCEEKFGKAWSEDSSLRREDLIIQTKCGIKNRAEYPHYNLSKKSILDCVDGSLKRLRTDYLDVLLLHRPDALTEPEEVAEAFELLEKSGKVRFFGVSNHKPMQIELLKKYVKQPLVANQLQFGLAASTMVANGMEVNMVTDGAVDRDESVLDYSRLNDITIQAWSPFQIPKWKGCFLDSENYSELNSEVKAVAEKYGVSMTTISVAWILRHPANMQVISGTTKPSRLLEFIEACDIHLTHEDWYRLYRSAGHLIP